LLMLFWIHRSHREQLKATTVEGLSQRSTHTDDGSASDIKYSARARETTEYFAVCDKRHIYRAHPKSRDFQVKYH
jgi:hypothetical protein